MVTHFEANYHRLEEGPDRPVRPAPSQRAAAEAVRDRQCPAARAFRRPARLVRGSQHRPGDRRDHLPDLLQRAGGAGPSRHVTSTACRSCFSEIACRSNRSQPRGRFIAIDPEIESRLRYRYRPPTPTPGRQVFSIAGCVPMSLFNRARHRACNRPLTVDCRTRSQSLIVRVIEILSYIYTHGNRASRIWRIGNRTPLPGAGFSQAVDLPINRQQTDWSPGNWSKWDRSESCSKGHRRENPVSGRTG